MDGRSTLSSWTALQAYYEHTGKALNMRQMFEKGLRAKKFSIVKDFGDGDMLFDYSKHLIEEPTMALLFKLARECGVEEGRDKMLSGVAINITENRAVLHTALRAPKGKSIFVDGKDVVPEVHVVLGHMKEFSNAVRSGAWLGFTGKVLRSV